MKYRRIQKPINVYISQKDKELLREIASKVEMPMSILVKTICNNFIEKYHDCYKNRLTHIPDTTDKTQQISNHTFINVCMSKHLHEMLLYISVTESLSLTQLIRKIIIDFLIQYQKKCKIFLYFK